MYEALLFDMNALGDIPDKDFTSRAALAGSSPGRGKGTGRSRHPPRAWKGERRRLQRGRGAAGRALRLPIWPYALRFTPLRAAACGQRVSHLGNDQNQLGS